MGFDGVDLSDRSWYRAGFPHDLFARLRREAPVWRHPDTPGVRESVGETGFWAVSTMDLVRRVARDEELFTAVEGPALRRFGPEWQGISLVSADGRTHRRLRFNQENDFAWDRNPFPFIEMNPEDMAELNLKPGDLVEVYNDNGSTQAMVYPTDTAKRKQTFMLFAYPTGVQGNVVSAGVNEFVIPNYK